MSFRTIIKYRTPSLDSSEQASSLNWSIYSTLDSQISRIAAFTDFASHKEEVAKISLDPSSGKYHLSLDSNPDPEARKLRLFNDCYPEQYTFDSLEEAILKAQDVLLPLLRALTEQDSLLK